MNSLKYLSSQGLQVGVCPHGGTVVSLSHSQLLKKAHYTPAQWNVLSFSSVQTLNLLSPLALGGQSTFTPKQVRQERWGERKGQEMNRLTELVPLAWTSQHLCTRLFLDKLSVVDRSYGCRIYIYNGPVHLLELITPFTPLCCEYVFDGVSCIERRK